MNIVARQAQGRVQAPDRIFVNLPKSRLLLSNDKAAAEPVMLGIDRRGDCDLRPFWVQRRGGDG